MGRISLNKYTGQPKIAVPLFQKKIRGFAYHLYLGYDVTGIRNRVQSGWVGTGWALQVGGVVSRTVVGIPDDYNNGGSCGNPMGPGMGVNYDCYFNVKSYIANGTHPDKIRKFWFNAQYESYPRLDYQQDIYHFNFLGHSGRFLIGRLGVIQKIGRDNHLKITAVHQSDWRSSIKSFEITDANGYVYSFEAIETTTNKRRQIVETQNGLITPGDYDSFSDISFRSAWKLTSVKDPYGKNLMTLIYQTVTEKPKSPRRRIVNEVSPQQIHLIKSYQTGSESQDCAQAIDHLRPRKITTYNLKTITSKKVTEVDFVDGVKLNFDLILSHPEYRDAAGVKLHRIEITQNTDPNKKSTSKTYIFKYDQTTANAKKLLFLDEIDIDDQYLNYRFHYKDLDNLASFGNETTDAFGYYQSDSGPNDLHKSYRTEAASGALDTIKYPTGGKRVFNWEENTYSFYKGDKLLPKIKILNNPDNYSITLKHTHLINCENSNPNNGINGNHCTLDFTINQDQSIAINYHLNFDLNNSSPGATTPCAGYQQGNGLGYNNWYLEFTNNTTNAVSRFYFKAQQGEGKITLNAGGYTIRLRTLCQFDPDKVAEISLKLKNIHTDLNWFLYGGGVRIRSIADYDKGRLKRKKVFNYQLEDLSHLDTINHDAGGGLIPIGGHQGKIYYSSGSFDGISIGERKYSITEHPYQYPTGLNVTYQITESLNSAPAQLTHDSYVGYKNVAVFRTSHQDVPESLRPVTQHSVVKYTYDSPLDFPRFPDFYNFPFIAPTTIDYKRGNIRQKKVFNRIKLPSGDHEFRLIQKSDYSYNYDLQSIAHPVTTTYHNVNNIHNRRLGRWFVDYGGYKSYINGLESDPTSVLHGGLPCFCPHPLLCHYPVPIGNTINVIPPHSRQEVRYKTTLTGGNTTAYFYDAQGNPHELYTTQKYTYDPANAQIKENILKRGSEKTKVKYYYSADNSAYNSANLSAYHRLNTVLAVEKYRNGKKVATRINRYKTYNGDPRQLYLHKVQSVKYHPPGGSGPLYSTLGRVEDRIIYHQYDAYGNPVEASQADGTPVTYIWGYHHTLPVAKIVNATAQQVKGVSGIPGLSLSGHLNAAQKQALRNDLPQAMVSTYTFDVLKGMTAQTDPRGRKTTFEYDYLNRLENIRDNEGHLRKHYTYYYYSQLLQLN